MILSWRLKKDDVQFADPAEAATKHKTFTYDNLEEKLDSLEDIVGDMVNRRPSARDM